MHIKMYCQLWECALQYVTLVLLVLTEIEFTVSHYWHLLNCSPLGLHINTFYSFRKVLEFLSQVLYGMENCNSYGTTS
jgi:hypothetical protein